MAKELKFFRTETQLHWRTYFAVGPQLEVKLFGFLGVFLGTVSDCVE